ncbi:MAG: mannosyltransferase family protein [Vicinamibacterales bacterium]
MRTIADAWQSSDPRRVAYVRAVAAIAYIFVAGWLGATLLPRWRHWGAGVPHATGLDLTSLDGLFVRWDAGYYWTIATMGYGVDLDARAFFPGYPFLVRAVTALTGCSLFTAGGLISVTCFVGAGALLHHWVRQDHGDDLARRATVLFQFSPLSFFYVAFYAESLFIFLALLGLVLARSGRFALSGVAIAAAGATRPQAFLLAIPYVVEFWLQRPWTRAAWTQFAGGALVAPLGTLAYVRFLSEADRPFVEPYFILLQKSWATHLTWPWVTLIDGLSAAVHGKGIAPVWFSRVYATHDLLYALAGLALTCWAARRLRPSAAAYLLGGVALFYVTHGPYGHSFDSFPRHLLSIAPVYVAGALFVGELSPRIRAIVLWAGGLQLGFLSAWFASGRWVS